MIRVLRTGALVTVQDLGRPGMQHLAIAPGGAIDAASHRVANALVGNEEDAATLEIALAGPVLEFADDVLIALHGARFETELDGGALPASRPVLVRCGARLRIGAATEGVFGYLAVAGGIAVPEVLASRSTYLSAGFGGVGGAALTAGSELPLVSDAAELSRARFAALGRHTHTVDVAATTAASVRWSAPAMTLPETEPIVIRVVDGVHAEWFDKESRALFVRERWRVAPASNRMGYRLTGSALALEVPREIASQPVCFGTVQVPAGGQPIVLMADRQTTGGYPRIAEVVTADVARLAQAAPGRATVRFERATLDAADAARELATRRVDELLERLRWEFGDEGN